MPIININNTTVYYEDSAPNDAKKPVMVFAQGLLWNVQMYDKQVEHFRAEYRCIAFDFRGQGQSKITSSGYDMETLTEDTLGLLAALNIEQCHFVGASMGGFVAQRIALKRPDLLQSLILLGSSADAEDPQNLPPYRKLVKAIRWLGIKRVSNKVMPVMFGSTFLTDKSRKTVRKQWLTVLQGNRKGGVIKAAMGVIERTATYEQLADIKTPTLIMVGDEDTAMPYAKSERMHFAIVGSKLAVIKGAGHTATIEAPEQVNQMIRQFLANGV